MLIVLAIIIVLFGARRLSNVSADLGAAIKNFRSAIKEGGDETGEKPDEEEAKPVHREVKSENTGKD